MKLFYVLAAILLTSCATVDKTKSISLDYVMTSDKGFEAGLTFSATDLTPEQMYQKVYEATREILTIKEAKSDSSGTHVSAVVKIPSVKK